MDVLVKRRGTTRTSVTRSVNQIETKLKGNTITIEEAQSHIAALITYQELLASQDIEIQGMITDDTELSDDMRRAAGYTDDIVSALGALKARMCTLQSQANASATSGAASTANVNSPVANASFSAEPRSYNQLPKQQMSVFSGDPMKWPEFWDDFKATIHDLTDMSETRKFKYLRQSLRGEAFDLVRGFTLSDVNYHQVIALLQERYADPQVTIFAHFESLLSIQESSHEVDKLRATYNQCEAHVRSLVALGLKEDTFGQVFVPILLSKMPKYVRVELHRKNGSTKWTLQRLRELMKDEIDARDRADRCFMKPKIDTRPSDSRSKGTFKGGKGFAGSASALVTTAAGKTQDRVLWCSFCQGAHYSDVCDVYKDYESRMAHARDLCMCCLGRGHKARDCRRKRICLYCNKNNHHRSLCKMKYPKETGSNLILPVKGSEEEEFQDEPQDILATIGGHERGSVRSIMQTAFGQLRGSRCQAPARFVFDTAASRSFITQAKANEIGARQVGEDIVSLGRFRENKRSSAKYKMVEVDAVSHTGEKKTIQLAVVDVITSPIQLVPLDSVTRSKLQHVRLAEMLVIESVSVTVDVLVGLDWYFQFIDEEQIRFPSGSVFMASFFGYVAGGSVSAVNAKKDESNLFTFVTRDESENFEMEKFWSLEDLGIKDSPLNNEDELALKKFKETLVFENNRFFVKWPWKDGIPEIPTNYGLAIGRLRSLLRRHSGDPTVVERYEKTFKDQLNAGIIERAPEVPTGVEHYIPHQCVIKSTSNTTKFRVVMDASAKSAKQSRSINDCFYHCPLILSDLVGVILRFRRSAIGLVGDIEKAYLQIGLQESERDCTRFLWLKDTSKPVEPANIVVFRFKRVPFGFSPSAFLLGGSVDALLLKEGTVVANDVRENIFVDNVFGGRESEEAAVEYVHEAIAIFCKASMNLREWYSNCPAVTASIPEQQRGSGTCTKVLGLKWDIAADTFTCPTGVSTDSIIRTKRQILKSIATVYDPCGFFTPLTVTAKILMQQLWVSKVGWDAEISPEHLVKWASCSANLQSIPSFQIPRQFQASVCGDSNLVELHCFCDASSKAYAAVVYVVIRSGCSTSSDILLSKSRVNPVKPLAVPRLELMAALIGCRLIKFVEKEIQVSIARKFIWSDSKCTLHWIRGKQTYTRFVENRLKEIRSVPDLKFRYVPTQENPADWPSRGVCSEELRGATLWWHGPKFLCKDELLWPVQDIEDEVRDEAHDSEVAEDSFDCDALVVPGVATPSGGGEPILDVSQYSSLRKLLGVTAYVFRFGQRPHSSGPLSAEELDKSLWFWLKQSQESYLTEFMSSKQAKYVNQRKQLGLFIDENGVARCRGRLQNSDMPYEAQNPVLLPRKSHFTKLVIRSCHSELYHAGPQHTLAKLRERYWVTGGKAAVKAVLKDCNLCRKHQGGPFRVPEPPPLPSFRVNRSRPFSHIGLDYLGPLFVKTNEGELKKVWVCLMTCAATRAVHLEVAEGLSTEEFLLCFRRFMALYGVPDVVVSDNAKQFHAANKTAQRMWTNARKSKEVREFAASKGIRWQFITQLAPWMGGFYERLVSPVKRALKRCLDRRCVSVRELQTVAYEIATVVNTRPLTSLDTEAGSMSLTPAHFLLRDPSHVPSGKAPAGDKAFNQSGIRDWHRSQRLLDTFWNIWRKQYLAELRTRLWSHRQRDTSVREPQVGTVVQVSDKLPSGAWRLGRITNVIKGADGKVRSATVRMSNGNEVNRSIKFLHPLEFDESRPKNDKVVAAIPGVQDSGTPADSSDEE